MLYEKLAEILIEEFRNIKCNKFSFDYHADKYRTRMLLMKINYERSQKLPFSIANVYQRGLIKAVDSYEAPRVSTIAIAERISEFQPIFDQFLFCVPKVAAKTPQLVVSPFSTDHHREMLLTTAQLPTLKALTAPFHSVEAALKVHFPGKNIILYDSGKLVKMVGLLKLIKQRGEKALVFTQMTRMLDIFEKVLNMNRFNYVRLDGSTKTEMRQQLV